MVWIILIRVFLALHQQQLVSRNPLDWSDEVGFQAHCDLFLSFCDKCSKFLLSSISIEPLKRLLRDVSIVAIVFIELKEVSKFYKHRSDTAFVAPSFEHKLQILCKHSVDLNQ